MNMKAINHVVEELYSHPGGGKTIADIAKGANLDAGEVRDIIEFIEVSLPKMFPVNQLRQDVGAAYVDLRADLEQGLNQLRNDVRELHGLIGQLGAQVLANGQKD